MLLASRMFTPRLIDITIPTQGLARTVSCFVRTCASTSSLRDDVIDAVASALRTDALPGESRVGALNLPFTAPIDTPTSPLHRLRIA